jgi:hypothetical protein
LVKQEKGSNLDGHLREVSVPGTAVFRTNLGQLQECRGEAVRLARALGAELVLFHASVGAPSYNEGLFGGGDAQQFFDAQRAWVRETLNARAEAMRGNGIAARWVLAHGVPHERSSRPQQTRMPTSS